MSSEEKCFFVSSRGLLKSCNIKSYNPNSSSSDDYNYLNEMIIKNKMFNNMSIYVCNTMIPYFIHNIMPKINKYYILVSGDSDTTMPIDNLNSFLFKRLINNKFLIKWYSQNLIINDNSKCLQLPIGLDYHSIYLNKNHEWKVLNENHLPIQQEQTLKQIKNNSLPFYLRNNKIYANFTLKNDRFKDRISCLKEIPEKVIDKNMNFIKRTKNWEIMSTYAFVLSPSGNGIDCHRTWETLCLGCIPIMRTSKFKNLFEDLPVIIVENWKLITREFLDKKIEEFKNRTFNYEKLTLKYWVDEIHKI
jgi:hypothetical protein